MVTMADDDLGGQESDATYRIDAACDARPGGWACRVEVGEPPDGRGATHHDVSVDEAILPRTGGTPDVDGVERLVRETFLFLLEREPKESILRRFDLSVVERYFPEYPAEIRRRLSR